MKSKTERREGGRDKKGEKSVSQAHVQGTTQETEGSEGPTTLCLALGLHAATLLSLHHVTLGARPIL